MNILKFAVVGAVVFTAALAGCSQTPQQQRATTGAALRRCRRRAGWSSRTAGLPRARLSVLAPALCSVPSWRHLLDPSPVNARCAATVPRMGGSTLPNAMTATIAANIKPDPMMAGARHEAPAIILNIGLHPLNG